MSQQVGASPRRFPPFPFAIYCNRGSKILSPDDRDNPIDVKCSIHSRLRIVIETRVTSITDKPTFLTYDTSKPGQGQQK